MVARVFGTMASAASGTSVEAIVLRTVGPQGSLFELLLPAGMRVLSGELAEIDVLLDDERYFQPFRPFFDPTEGRPSIPIETYLRLMFLKYRFDLGYERLCVAVTDSLSWRRFCRIGLEAAVPDESTIRKITRRCGPALIEALNAELLHVASERGVVSLERVRVDTTVVEADVKYPTDSGLLTAATCRIASRLRRLGNAGVTITFEDRTAAARAHQHSIGAWLRRRSDEAKTEVLAITGLLADLAEQSVTEAVKALNYKARRRKVRRMLDDLAVLVERTQRVIAQARVRVDGGQPDGSTRLVSCMNRMLVRSAKDGSANPSSSATRPKSSTTSTGSSSITRCTSATPPTPHCCDLRSNASPTSSARHQHWSPPIVATGTPASRQTSPTSVSRPW